MNRMGVFFFQAYPINSGSILLPNSTLEDQLNCNTNKIFVKVGTKTDFLCHPEITTFEYPKILLAGAIASIICLFLTLLVYTVLPELQTLPGKNFMCYISCLLVSFTTLVFSTIGPKYYNQILCIVIGLLLAASKLSAFFWLSVIGYSLWWSFSTDGFHSRLSAIDKNRTFLYNSFYAWGMTFLLLIFTFLIDWMPSKSFPSWFIRPGFGVTRCWYSDDANVLYFFAPITLLLISNFIFFGLTEFNFFKLFEETSILKTSAGGNYSDRYRFGLHVKIFFLLGLNWISEIFAQSLNSNRKFYTYFYYSTNLINSFHGVFIFLIFICKSRIVRALWVKLGPAGSKDVVARGGVRGAWKPR